MNTVNVVNRVRRGDTALAGSDLELHMAALMRTQIRLGMLPHYETEYRFHPRRRWRFDFAWPGYQVAVEVDGLVHSSRGGHQTVAGILADAEKAEAALRAGWIVYRVPGPWLTERSYQVIETIQRLLTDRGFTPILKELDA